MVVRTALDGAIGKHKTATSDGSWDGPANEMHCPATEAALRAAFAWVDPEGDPVAKSSYKFIHHEVSMDGNVGAANMTACSAGIAVLNGGRGGTTIPDGDRQGVYNHLAGHLRDGGREPPALQDQLSPWPQGGARMHHRAVPGLITVAGMDEYVARRDAARPRAAAQPPGARWYRVEDAGDSATVAIYDDIGFWGITARDFIEELDGIKASALTVCISSGGGDVFDGVAVYNALLRHPATVTTVVDGLAASIASVIAQAGDHRIVAKASQTMIHDPYALTLGNAAEMRRAARMLDQIGGMIATVYADRAGGTVKFWTEAMAEESWYGAEEAKRAGLADAVFGDTSPEVADALAAWDMSLFRHAGRARATAPPMPSARPAARANTDFRWDPEAFRAGMKEAFQ